MAEFQFDDAAFEAATRRGEAARASVPIPSAARYDAASGRIVVDFANGAAFMVPARSLQGLEDATEAELREVEILGETGLHWETRDVDFSIAGLMAGIFGTARFVIDTQKERQGRPEADIAVARGAGGKPSRTRPSEEQ